MANIRASIVVTSIISVAIAAGSVSATVAPRSINAVYTPNISISAAIQLIPLKEFERQAVSTSDAIGPFAINKVILDISTVTDNVAISFDKVLTDSVTATDLVNKVFVSSVDFDLSDPDVDPDPINVSDSDVKSVDKKLVEATVVSDLVAKVVDTSKTETLQTQDEIFTIVGKNLDNSVAITELLAVDVTTGKTDSIAASEAHEIEFTKGNISDATTSSDLALLNAGLNKESSITAQDAVDLFVIGKNPSDSVAVTDSIDLLLTLGDSMPLFDFAFIADDKYTYFPVPGTLNNHLIHQPLVNGEFVLTTDPNAGIVYTIRPESVSYMFGGYGINENQFN